MADVTIICIVRHGYATTAMTIENLYASSEIPFNLIFADMASPPSTRAYLEEQAAGRDNFVHLRFDEFRSRQSARLEALKLVDTRYVVLIDNNILCERGWLENLIGAQQETDADMVSPLILTHGGDVHFSAGLVVREPAEKWWQKPQVERPHQQPGVRAATNFTENQFVQIDIDFVESHCCLALTDSLRLPRVLVEKMHNAQTTAYASYRLKFKHGKRLVLEPSAVVSIVPIGFGYDLPWVCTCYMDLEMLKGSYRRFEALIGKGPGTDVNRSLKWHAHHLKHILLSMLEDNRLDRTDQIDIAEVPAYIRGYDHQLPQDADIRINDTIRPFVEKKYPELRDLMDLWLSGAAPQATKLQRLVPAWA